MHINATYMPTKENIRRVKQAYKVDGCDNDRQKFIMGQAADLSFKLLEECPPGLELDIALTRIEEAVCWAFDSMRTD